MTADRRLPGQATQSRTIRSLIRVQKSGMTKGIRPVEKARRPKRLTRTSRRAGRRLTSISHPGIASREFRRTVATDDVFGGSKVGLRAMFGTHLARPTRSIEDESNRPIGHPRASSMRPSRSRSAHQPLGEPAVRRPVVVLAIVLGPAAQRPPAHVPGSACEFR
jgi:hypothetical protein